MKEIICPFISSSNSLNSGSDEAIIPETCQLLQKGSIGLGVFDTSGNLLESNPKIRMLLNLNNDTVINFKLQSVLGEAVKEVSDIVPLDSVECITKACKIVSPEEGERWTRLSLSPVANNHGEKRFLVAGTNATRESRIWGEEVHSISGDITPAYSLTSACERNFNSIVENDQKIIEILNGLAETNKAMRKFVNTFLPDEIDTEDPVLLKFLLRETRAMVIKNTDLIDEIQKDSTDKTFAVLNGAVNGGKYAKLAHESVIKVHKRVRRNIHINIGNEKLLLETTDVRTIIDKRLEQMSATADKLGAKFSKMYENKLPNIEADQDKLDIAIGILLDNAIQSIEESEESPNRLIIVRAQVVKSMDESNIDMLMIAVRDTGVGIPEEIQNKIGEELFTTKKSGHGIGIKLVKDVAIAHGGKLEFSSITRKSLNEKLKQQGFTNYDTEQIIPGTEFRLYLPVQ